MPPLELRGDGDVAVPGGGVAERLHRACAETGAACCALLRFCSEGDNAGDALELARTLLSWPGLLGTGVEAAELRGPPSWRALHGNRVDPSLFR